MRAMDGALSAVVTAPEWQLEAAVEKSDQGKAGIVGSVPPGTASG